MKMIEMDNISYKKLSEILTIKNGKDYKSHSKGNVPVYGSGGIISYIDTAVYDKPSVLIPRKGSLDKLYFVDTPFWNVDTIFYTEINTELVEPRYLYHYLKQAHLEKLNKAGGVPSLTQAVLNNLTIPLPPLPIQQEIVRILDTFTNLTAELTNKLNAELTARRKQYEYYRDELLTFGEDVEYKKLGEVVSMKAGKAIKAQDIGEKNELFSIPCYGGNGLRGYVKDANCSGDKVLIGRQGALCGNVCFVSGEFYATEHAVVVSSDNNVDMRFLFHLLLKLNLNQYKTAGAQPGLSVSKLETVKVQIPSIEYQRRVSKVLDLFSRYIDNLEDGLPAEISARQKQYEYYRDQLLSFQKEKE